MKSLVLPVAATLLFVSSGLADGERIAVSGAQSLLSAEQLAAGGGEAD